MEKSDCQHQIEGQEDTAQKCERCCIGHSPILPGIESLLDFFLHCHYYLNLLVKVDNFQINPTEVKNLKSQERTKTEHITKLLKCPQVTLEKVDENIVS